MQTSQNRVIFKRYNGDF